jgi:hypothetical protein
MNAKAIQQYIEQYKLHEVKEWSLTRPEGIPTILLDLFPGTRDDVRAFTDDAKKTWLLFDKANRYVLKYEP